MRQLALIQGIGRIPPNFIDLAGRRFGKLIVVERSARNGSNGEPLWTCRCDCGATSVVYGSNLRRGLTKGCGCGRERTPDNFTDLTGRRFGKLTVLGRSASARGWRTRWRCQCTCGRTIVVRGSELKRSGTSATVSCGTTCDTPPGEVGFKEKWHSYRVDARRRGYAWALDEKAFRTLMHGDCHYCGGAPAQIVRARGGRRRAEAIIHSAFVYNGIDRLNNALGYVPGNVVSCCGDCNRAKRVMTHDEFLSWVERVYSHSIAVARSRSA